jgi:hypothetical protein
VKIINFMLADAVSHGRDGKLFVHGGGITEIDATEFPHTEPRFGIVITLVREDEAPGSDHEVRLAFLSPSRGELPLGDPVSLRVPPDADTEAPMLINMVATFTGIEFPETGLYWLQLYFDEGVVSSLPLSIGRGEWLPRRWRSDDPQG